MPLLKTGFVRSWPKRPSSEDRCRSIQDQATRRQSGWRAFALHASSSTELRVCLLKLFVSEQRLIAQSSSLMKILSMPGTPPPLDTEEFLGMLGRVNDMHISASTLVPSDLSNSRLQFSPAEQLRLTRYCVRSTALLEMSGRIIMSAFEPSR